MRRLVADEGEPGEDHSECPVISDGSRSCRGGSTRSPHHPTRSANQRRGTEPRAPPLQPGLRTACQRQAGVWGDSVALGACRRRSGADRTTGARARCRRRPGQVGRVRSTLQSGIRSAVIIPMRQQPGPMLIFRLTEDRRSRLNVGRNGGNPHTCRAPGHPTQAAPRAAEEHVRGCCPDRGSRRLVVPRSCGSSCGCGWTRLSTGGHRVRWEAADTIPACWPQHPHLVHEIAVLADQRRRAGHAFTNDALEESHRYSLPALTERMTSRLRSHCEDGHQAWPAKGRYTRHTAEASRRSGRTDSRRTSLL